MPKKGTASIEFMKVTEHSPEELHRTLFEQAADGILIADASGRYIDVNPRCCEMLGYTREEMLRFTIGELVAPEDLQQTPLRLDDLRSGKVIISERRLRCKDGTNIPVEISARMLSDGLILALLRNISERNQAKEAEIQVHASEKRYRSLFENMLHGLAYCKMVYENGQPHDFIYLDVNKNFEPLTGLKNVVGKKVSEVIPGLRESNPELLEIYGKVAATGKPENFETFIEPLDLWLSISVYCPENGYFVTVFDNITDRRKSDETLRQAEQKYRSIFEYSLDGIFQSTPSGRFITVNSALARMWDYDSPDDLLNTVTNIASQIYVNPEQRKEFMRIMDEHGDVQSFEFQVYRKDGSVIWVEESVHSVKDSDGKLLYYEGTVKDITEQKHTMEALRRSEERYRRTLNNMLEGCQIIDYDWRYIYVNDTAALHVRRKPEELLLHTMQEMYPGIEYTELFPVLQHCMEKRTPRRLENQFTFPDGDTGWFELSIEPVPEGLFILSVDITERKQAEQELREREVLYRTLFENIPIPVFTKDLEGRYTSCNAEEAKYWAVNPIGHTDSELLPAEIADALRASDLRVMETGVPLFGEEKFQAPDGLHYALARKVPLYDSTGNMIGILGASVDISDRKQAEKKIRQQLGRLTALSEIDRVIASSFDVNLTLKLLTRHLVRQLEVDAASILVANPIANTLEFVAGDGFLGIPLKKIQVRVSEDYAGKVVLERRMLHIPNLEAAEPPFNRPSMMEGENFAAYIGLPLIAKGQLKGVLEIFQRGSLDPNDEEWLAFLETLAEQAAIAIDSAQLFNNLQQSNAELTLAYDATIEGWSYALDLRDKETEGHTQRVADITTKLCQKFGLSDQEITFARWGALLHDIGKMGIPDIILQKPAELTEAEWEIMKMHPIFARNMLERVNYLKSAIDIPYCHHEKWDGSGYPRGLEGKQIPFTARMFAVADVWDALTSDRPYRPAWSKSEALEYIKSAAGTHFDPQVVNMFLNSEDLWIS